MSGMFISFEGIDGCGKSTQAKLLKRYLEKRGEEVIFVREPGGTELSEKIRGVLLNPENDNMDNRTEALLLAASRAQLTQEVILPNLNEGRTVLCDRYVDSTIAYQGFGRELPIEWLEEINKTAAQGLKPSITVFVDVPVETALSRLNRKSFDRMEGEGKEFLNRVREGYLTLAEKHSKRYIVLDGTLEVDKIHQIIIKEFESKRYDK